MDQPPWYPRNTNFLTTVRVIFKHIQYFLFSSDADVFAANTTKYKCLIHFYKSQNILVRLKTNRLYLQNSNGFSQATIFNIHWQKFADLQYFQSSDKQVVSSSLISIGMPLLGTWSFTACKNCMNVSCKYI